MLEPSGRPDDEAPPAGEQAPPTAATVMHAPMHDVVSPEPPAYRHRRYGQHRRLSGKAVTATLLVHAVGLYLLALFEVIPSRHHDQAPLTVDLIRLEAPPPEAPPPPEPPEPKVIPDRPAAPAIVAPVHAVPLPSPTPPIRTVEQAPPPAAVSDAPAAPPAAPPVAVADLAARMISAVPPRYPVESRRRREAGVVLLSLLLAEDGSVEDVRVQSSSGFDRLDRAALTAVRRWRWSPTLVGGKPVKVRGLVRIPFEIRP